MLRAAGVSGQAVSESRAAPLNGVAEGGRAHLVCAIVAEDKGRGRGGGGAGGLCRPQASAVQRVALGSGQVTAPLKPSFLVCKTVCRLGSFLAGIIHHILLCIRPTFSAHIYEGK